MSPRLETGLYGQQAALASFEYGRSGGLADKVMPLSEAISTFIRPGAEIHVAYSDARPNAALLEIVRQFRGSKPDFTISTGGFVNVQHALVAEGLVGRVVSSFLGENYPAPRPSAVLQEAIAANRVEVENWSLWTLIARLVAGAIGLPFFPVHSLRGSDLEREHEGIRYARARASFGDEQVEVGVVKALRPDVVLLQGVAADEYGNLVLAAPYGEAFWGSLAARTGVIACVEQIVSSAKIREHNMLVQVPGNVVRAVCHVPFGSHPYGLYNPAFPGVSSYAQDQEFMLEVQEAMQTPERFTAWIDEWITKVADHDAYLQRLGSGRLATLVGQTATDLWRFEPLADGYAAGSDLLESERMVIAAANLIERRAVSESHRAMLAGVGYANLAAWLAARRLWRRDHDIHLMAEIGMFGYDPRPGDPFIFSSRNLPSCTMLTDVMSVLGTLVSGPSSRCIGVIGAGQVDQHGRVNSTVGPDGRYLVGSGGANDIASAAREVVVTVKHAMGRLVESVPYVTSPGDRVSAIVTTEGVLERRDGEFWLTRYFPHDGVSERDRIATIQASTGWDLRIAGDVAAEPLPPDEERTLLRQFDPEGTFIS